MKTEDSMTVESKRNLDKLCQGLMMFLHEVDEYRSKCIKHDDSSYLQNVKNGTLWLTKKYPYHEESVDIAQSSLEKMEGWQTKTCFADENQRKTLEKRARSTTDSIYFKGIQYGSSPMMVIISATKPTLTISIAQPEIQKPFHTFFPVKRISRALEIFEILVPEIFGVPIKVERNTGGHYPIRSYVERMTTDEDDVLSKVLIGWN